LSVAKAWPAKNAPGVLDRFTREVYRSEWMIFKVGITKLAERQLRKVP
jgi:hypothetical protein